MEEWNELQRIVRNAEYLGKIDRAVSELNAGKGITKTMEELEAVEDKK